MINSFLQPFIKELLSLWRGVVMSTAQGLQVLVRAAILCCGCDVPAARKVCGFKSCSAYMGCSKCLLPFPTAVFGEKADYTNTDRSQWTPRNLQEHKQIALSHKCCKTQAARESIEKQFGIRYSILNELPYFDPPRMCIIDPMHNLLLGTAKHMIEVWKSLKMITDKQFADIQKRIDSFTIPR